MVASTFVVGHGHATTRAVRLAHWGCSLSRDFATLTISNNLERRKGIPPETGQQSTSLVPNYTSVL